MSISQNFPEESPTLNLNFAGSRTLDSRITFNRTSSGTYMGSDGLIKVAAPNQPRFDHRYVNGEIESLGLLIEESRTNLLKRSQELATSPWTIIPGTGGTTTTANNVVISPDGTQNASQMNTTVFADGASVYQDVGSISGNGTYTLSVFVKGGTSNDITFAAFFIGNSTQAFSWGFNPLTGTLITTGSASNTTIVPYPNGWYRISFRVTGTNALNNTLRFQIYHQTAGITYLWGAQLEEGSFPTSYIPTEGSAVTRTADNASITGSNFSSWYNPNEGTVFSAFRAQSSATSYLMGISNNSTAELIYIRATATGSDSAMRDNSSDVAYKPIAYSRDINTLSKHCVSYKQNDFIVSAQGQISTVDDNCTVPTPTNISIGSLYNTTHLGGTISQLTYYPTRLPNSQLQALTR